MRVLPPIQLFVTGCAATVLVACGWISADGPWNDQPTPASPEGLVDLVVFVVTPDGGREVAGAEVSVLGEHGEAVTAGVTDAVGRVTLEAVPSGRHTLAARSGHLEGWRVVDLPVEPTSQALDPLRLEAALPVVLDVRDAISQDSDPVARRLEELGLTSVREGPESAAAAAQLFALPAGLFEYGLVLIGGELDYPALLDDEQAMAGLVDHLEDGGGLYLSGAAWPVLLALAPFAVQVSEHTTDFGYLESRVVQEELAEALGWGRVGVPLAAGLPVLESAGPESVVWLSGEVETEGEEVVDGPLMVEVEVGAGRILYVSFAAPEPRADEWWYGDPAAWELADGSWEGRGAAIDRMLLRL